MSKQRARRALPLLAAAAFAALAPTASAGTTAPAPEPAGVDVRVETPAWTTLRQHVDSADTAIAMAAGADYTSAGGYYGGTHTCDGRNNGNPNGYADGAATPLTALAAAAVQEGISWYAPFSATADDFPLIYRIGFDQNDSSAGPFFAIHVNGLEVTGLGCQVQLADGDEVVFTQGGQGMQVLEVAGPTVAYVGEPATFTVREQATGEPVSGATIASATTDADGEAIVTFTRPGSRQLAAEHDSAVRSAPIGVCVDYRVDPKCVGEDGEPVLPAPVPVVGPETNAPSTQPAPPCPTNGQDGRCGTLDWTPPQVHIATSGVQPVFQYGQAPTVFTGSVGTPTGDGGRLEAEPRGLKMVKARLTRKHKGRCFFYSPTYQAFRRMRKCNASRVKFFKLGVDAQWRFELPASLPRGRYVLDVNAVDAWGNRDWPAMKLRGRTNTTRVGQNRIIFQVR